MTADELRARSEEFLWFHSIDLGQGVVTTGLSEGPYLQTSQLPHFGGKSVLDIGAWDGYYSFLAEREGASRVVALDHYVWGVDIKRRQAYWDECEAQGVFPDHGRDTTDFWDPDLPGRRGFNLAKEALGSKVEPVLADFVTTDLDALGSFDVVLYLGGLYHMKEPFTALERLRRVTREVAVVETAAADILFHDQAPSLLFASRETFRADFGNWFFPSSEALRQMCLAAGFSKVEVVVDAPPRPEPPNSLQARAWSKLLRTMGLRPRPPPPKPIVYYRAVVRALV